MHAAAGYGTTVCFRELLEHGANWNARNKGSGTPLHLAAWSGHKDCVRALIGCVFPSQFVTKAGKRPLDYATLSPKADCASLLREWESLQAQRAP
ncbi:MAG: ankyrin repeat domain-containing protein [Hydrogenophaga sp.]|uniref:ankyrin repeat domain-containing protein n=1 Tax=Hydrogenophaga sp. TaxID=1904254 RepID=UPI002A05F5B1|nr:ankyrin repeat domain-containing protein [Hydrogenophaga sp.]